MRHPTTRELEQFLRGGLRPGRVRDIADHLRECSQCAGAGIDPADHPSLEAELMPYAEGRLDSPRIAAHLETCAICREDVEDIRAMAALLAPERRAARWPYFMAAAAILAAIALAVLLMRQPAPVVPGPPAPQIATSEAPPPVLARSASLRPKWKSAIDQALRDGKLAKPAVLAELQLPSDPERGPSAARVPSLAPAGVIVETTRPQFAWTPVNGATYVVSVLDEDLDPVAESTTLKGARWQPDRELARGRMYQWQVVVRSGEQPSILPAPPAPPAVFRVLDEDAHQELERARAERGGDPLLLGVLYARHGLREEALRELAKVDSEDGRRLLRSVEAW